MLGALGVGPESGLTEARSAVLFAVFGFGLLGLIDDLAAVGEDRGFKGHLGALREGRVTTGMLKLVGGAAVAVVLVATPGFKSGRTLIVDALLIALAANLGNLLDRAPGRTIKFGLVAYVPIAIAVGTAPIGIAIAPVMGAALGLLGDDLHERLMLGDTGANVIGAVLGLAVVLGSRDSIRLAVMLVLLALNVAAELVSFSRVIDAVPSLRWFDRLGEPPPPELTRSHVTAGSDRGRHDRAAAYGDAAAPCPDERDGAAESTRQLVRSNSVMRGPKWTGGVALGRERVAEPRATV